MTEYPEIKPIKYPADYYLNSPALLWSKASAYFAAIDKANETAQERIPFMHSTFAMYLGITYEEWQQNQSDLRAYLDFMTILDRIDCVIHNDQFTGAAVVNIYPEEVLNETYWKWHEAKQKFNNLNK